jgi:hypothetical protein
MIAPTIMIGQQQVVSPNPGSPSPGSPSPTVTMQLCVAMMMKLLSSTYPLATKSHIHYLEVPKKAKRRVGYYYALFGLFKMVRVDKLPVQDNDRNG